MGHSYSAVLVNLVFSTKQRARNINEEHREKLWAYLRGICENIRVPVLAVGGTDDHLHMLVAIPPAVTLSSVISKVKANSSRWMRERVPNFEWQEGYGAFSVSASQADAVISYIDTQKQHHAKVDFAAEFTALLERYGVQYDPRFVLG